jgi:RNA polymerase sigma factor (sigma-70 family)
MIDTAAAFERHYRLVVGVIWNRLDTSERSIDLAEDLAMDTFARLIEVAGRYQAATPQADRALIVRIARNEVADYYRDADREIRRANRHALDVNDNPAALALPAPQDDLDDVRRDRRVRERIARLRRIIPRLQPHHRKILDLRVFRGMRNKEIAAATGRSQQSVAKDYFNAIGALRRELGASA